MSLVPGTVFRTIRERPFIPVTGDPRKDTGVVDLQPGEHVIFVSETLEYDDGVGWLFVTEDGRIVRDGVGRISYYGIDRVRELGFEDLEEVK